MNVTRGRPLKIKLLGKSKPGSDGAGWHRRFPGDGNGPTVWEDCVFVLERDSRDYDWLVVYDDMPSVGGERHTMWEEELACPRANTMLITTEPSTIKVYGSRFLNQFGWVLTSQEPWVVRHPGSIFRQPGLVWFYSDSDPRGNYDTIRKHVPLHKTGEISAVCSTKQQKHTLHHQRYDFIMGLKSRIPEMELFGRGVRFVEDKADALDPFKYHVAIENFHGRHHWTEKLADPFLGACMPVYYGCPNAEEYFPEKSILRIDIASVEAAAEKINRAIKDKTYEKSLPDILESRRLVLEKYSPVAQIADIVRERDAPLAVIGKGEMIASRHLFRKRNLFNGMSYAIEKTRIALTHKLRNTNF